MNPTLALGIDIGGTNTAFGFVDRRGQITHKGTIPTKGHLSIGLYIEALCEAIEPIIKEVGHRSVVGAGVGAPNANFYTGEIAFAPNLPWEGIIPLSKLLKEALNMNVVITNDANAAAIGEMTYGAAKGLNDFFMVTLGTGVGSGIVANGKLIYGHDGFAGELGHMIAVRDGRVCGCGRKGCLETYASATGIVRTANEWLEREGVDSLLLAKKGNLTSRDIYYAANDGDALALDIFEFTAKILGQTLADAVTITSPQDIVFFGGLSFSGAFLMDPIRKYLEQNLLKIYKNKITILHSELPDSDAAILGASALAW
jgi:glucokinase